MKLVASLLFLIGVTLVVITLSQETSRCPPPQVEYRFVPRTFKESQETPIKVSEIFDSMFEKPSPFMNRISGREVTKSNINRFFVSQS
jgi:hypothetical protein